MSHADIRKYHSLIKVRKLVVVSILVGFVSAFLALALKHLTEHYEAVFFAKTQDLSLLLVIFPFIGLTVIYFLRQYLFKNKPNKGITEIFESTNSKKKNLPMYKIPSHFFNGLLTVVFGGSTGIEVSTVVASATVGSVAQQKANFFRQYKTELICAGIAAGITALFNSPIAGILFAFEVISRKTSRAFFTSTILAVLVAFGLLLVAHEAPFLSVSVETWHYSALPYFVLLGIVAGLNAVYLTRCVLFCKRFFADYKIGHKIVFSAAAIGIVLLILPQLYGDGYHAMKDILSHPDLSMTTAMILSIIAIIILKPILTSLTLAAGGDGGVFAPSLFLGAFVGLLVATGCNAIFGADVIPLNFMIIGMAATLSASIHAPLTALFLVCGWIDDYTLFIPILLTCLIAKYTAKAIFPRTVYSVSIVKS